MSRDLVTRCPGCRRLAPVIGGRVVAHFGRDLVTECPGSSRVPAGEVVEYAEAARRTYSSSDAPAAKPAAAGPAKTLLDAEG